VQVDRRDDAQTKCVASGYESPKRPRSEATPLILRDYIRGRTSHEAGAAIQKELWLCIPHLDIGLLAFTNMIEVR
jgi:hypothetical protein